MLKEEVLDMKKSVTEMHKNLEMESTFALNLLHEVKQSAKRWFIISIILLVALVGTNVAWLVYESSFDTVYEGETTTVDGGNGVATYLENSNSGDINYGENN